MLDGAKEKTPQTNWNIPIMKKILFGCGLLLLSAGAQAQNAPGAYATIGGGLLTFDDGVDSVEPKQLFGRLGYDINAYVGFGIESGFSLIEDEVSGVDFDVTTLFIFLKGSIPVGNGSSLYVLYGNADTELTGSSGGLSLSADDDDTGIGFGIQVPLDTTSISIDYIKYFDDDGVEVDSINLGLTSHF